MLDTYSQNISVTADTIIPFNTNALRKNCTVMHSDGSTAIKLARPGVYAVYFNATGTTTDAGTFGVQMLNGGTAVPQAAASTTTAAGDTASVNFSTLVFVSPSCSCVNNSTSLSFQYTGSAGTIANANTLVLKVS